MLPAKSDIVIVGGGIIGCSVAYHLSRLLGSGVFLLEQHRLGGGTTWHAAGQVGRVRTSTLLAYLTKTSEALYARLGRETGLDTGWTQAGSLMLAQTDARLHVLKRTVAMSNLQGIEAHIVPPEVVAKKWPLMEVGDVKGALWAPGDGQVDPLKATLALAACARRQGATLLEGVGVHKVLARDGRAFGVATDRGDVLADAVVLCGGMWSRQLGLASGLDIPAYPLEHHYVVSEPLEGVADDLPTVRDPDSAIYLRAYHGALLAGAFPQHAKPWKDRIPEAFSFELLEPDWERFEQPLQAAGHRVPALKSARIERFVNGPESFTFDGQPLLGETPELKGCFVAAGFNSGGIVNGGGVGELLAEWIVNGDPGRDVSGLDIRRFMPFHNEAAVLKERVVEVLGRHYQIPWPNEEYTTARGLQTSALFERLEAKGAHFGQKMGWERPLWFGEGLQRKRRYGFGKPDWFETARAEHLAARDRVVLFDQSSFAKFRLAGRDACWVLQRLCANDVDVPVGRVVYTAMLNERGTFESDLTVTRLAPDEYYLVSSTGSVRRDADWISKNTPEGAEAAITEVGPRYGVLGVMGPRSRALLSRACEADFSADAFPFGTAKKVRIGSAEALALRITYVGELGWELHTPMGDLPGLYHRLNSLGQDLGLCDAGYHAIDSLRLEKRYLAFPTDISADDTPLEAGLGFAVAWDKASPFIGRDALIRQKREGLKRRLLAFVLEDPSVMLWGGEPILRQGEIVGYTTSAAYGHSLGSAVAVGYVKIANSVTLRTVVAGPYQVEVAGERRAARAYLKAPFDPQRERLLC